MLTVFLLDTLSFFLFSSTLWPWHLLFSLDLQGHCLFSIMPTNLLVRSFLIVVVVVVVPSPRPAAYLVARFFPCARHAPHHGQHVLFCFQPPRQHLHLQNATGLLRRGF